MKKTLTKLLAGALALSMMAVPAFAAEGDTIDGTTQNVDGTIIAAPIDVAISGTPKIIVNPYQLIVKISDNSVQDSAAADGTTSSDSIISVPFYITNSGKTALEVSATITGETASEKANAVTFATAPFLGGTKAVTAKQVFVYSKAQLASKADTDGVTTWKPFDAKTDLVAAAGKASKSMVLFTLAPKMTSGQDETKSNIGAVKLFGEANGNAAEAWATGNTVKVTYAFTIRPCMLPST